MGLISRVSSRTYRNVVKMSSSAATKRKHVIAELEDFVLPEPHETIARVGANKGSCLLEIFTPERTAAGKPSVLASLPKKFRNNVWVKRDTFVYVIDIEEGNKVKAEIVRLLTSEHRKWLEEQEVWPSEFDQWRLTKAGGDCVSEKGKLVMLAECDGSGSDEELEDSYFQRNVNRRNPYYDAETESSSEE